MILSSLAEQAWRTDECVRVKESIKRLDKREYWRKRILAIEEHHLDYERKLLPMKAPKKKPFSLFRFFKSIAP